MLLHRQYRHAPVSPLFFAGRRDQVKSMDGVALTDPVDAAQALLDVQEGGQQLLGRERCAQLRRRVEERRGIGRAAADALLARLEEEGDSPGQLVAQAGQDGVLVAEAVAGPAR